MRLSPEQRLAIQNIANKLLGSSLIAVYLYGSRTQDALKGGDIDLVFLIKEESAILNKIPSQYKVLNELKKDKHIGDRQIDLKIVTQTQINQDEFLKSVQKNFQEI